MLLLPGPSGGENNTALCVPLAANYAVIHSVLLFWRLYCLRCPTPFLLAVFLRASLCAHHRGLLTHDPRPFGVPLIVASRHPYTPPDEAERGGLPPTRTSSGSAGDFSCSGRGGRPARRFNLRAELLRSGRPSAGRSRDRPFPMVMDPLPQFCQPRRPSFYLEAFPFRWGPHLSCRRRVACYSYRRVIVLRPPGTALLGNK